jgi:hypothetical protein
MQKNDNLRWLTATDGVGKYYELRAGDQVLGTLRYSPKAAITWGFSDRRHATAEAGAARWEFSVERKGLLGLLGFRATIHVTGSNVAQFAAGAYFVNGTLVIEYGRRFEWSGGSVRLSTSRFFDENGHELIAFKPGSIFDSVNTYVEVSPEGTKSQECPLLLALGLYLRLAMNKVYR